MGSVEEHSCAHYFVRAKNLGRNAASPMMVSQRVLAVNTSVDGVAMRAEIEEPQASCGYA